MISVTQLCSAWILILILVDWWIRTRFPFKAGILCTPKKALYSVAALMIVIIGLNSHYLLPSFGMLIPGYLVLACAPDIYNASFNIFYYLVWNIIQVREVYTFLNLLDIKIDEIVNFLKRAEHRKFY